jgi:hypothetical protein
LRKAVDAKSSGDFGKAFGKLTDACNRHHRAAGVGFIVIRASDIVAVQQSVVSADLRRDECAAVPAARALTQGNVIAIDRTAH